MVIRSHHRNAWISAAITVLLIGLVLFWGRYSLRQVERAELLSSDEYQRLQQLTQRLAELDTRWRSQLYPQLVAYLESGDGSIEALLEFEFGVFLNGKNGLKPLDSLYRDPSELAAYYAVQDRVQSFYQFYLNQKAHLHSPDPEQRARYLIDWKGMEQLGNSDLFTPLSQGANNNLAAMVEQQSAQWQRTYQAVVWALVLLVPLVGLGAALAYASLRFSKVQGQLAQSRGQSDVMLEASPDPFLVVDSDGKITSFNARAQELFGYPKQSFLGMSVDELVPTEARKYHARLRATHSDPMVLKKMAPNREVKAVAMGGREFPVSINISTVRFENQLYSIVALRDLSEESYLKRTIVERQTRIDIASKAARLSMFSWEPMSDRIELEPGLAELIAIDRNIDRPVLRDLLKAVDDDDKKQINFYLLRLSAGQSKEESLDFTARGPDGFPHQFRLTGVPIRDPEKGVVARITAVCIDITEMNESRQELMRATVAAERAANARNQLLAQMSHQVRNPLNAMLGMLNLIDASQLSDKNVFYLTGVKNSGNTLQAILNDILDETGFATGRLSLKQTPIKLDAVVNEVLDMYAPLAQRKGLAFNFDVDGDCPDWLLSDPMRLSQLLGNLLSNAIRFTERGSVGLDIRFQSEVNGRACLRFAVTDTGVGMSEAQGRRLREIAENPAETLEYGQSGLGLSISNRILALMGSKMMLESVPGQGSEFSFEIDFELPEQAVALRDWRFASERRVLVCGDSQQLAYISQWLSSWGARCDHSSDISQALVMVAASKEGDYDSLILACDDARGQLIEHPDFKQLMDEVNHRGAMRAVIAWSYELVSTFNLESRFYRLRSLPLPVTPTRLFNLIESDVLQWQQHTSDSASEVASELVKQGRLMGKRLLLVEDAETNQLVIEDFLARIGTQVETVASGEAALERLAVAEFDAVLMDINLPGMSGLEATRQLRHSYSAEQLPVIALTAAAFDSDRNLAYAAGMNGFLPKPVRFEQLCQVLAAHLKSREIARQSSDTEPDPIAKSDLTTAAAVVSQAAAGGELPIPAGLERAEIRARFNNDRTLLLSCLRAFTRDFSPWQSEFIGARSRQEQERMRSLAHKLKGASATLGALTLHRAVCALEAQLHEDGGNSSGSSEVAHSVLEQLEMLLVSVDQTIPLLEGPIPTADATGDSLISRQEAEQLLQTLTTDMAQNRYISAEKMSEYCRLLSHHYAPEQVDMLRVAHEVFDFKTARSVLACFAVDLAS